MAAVLGSRSRAIVLQGDAATSIHAFNVEVRPQMKCAGLLRAVERVLPIAESLQWTRAQCRLASSDRPGDVLTFHREVAGFSQDGSWYDLAWVDRLNQSEPHVGAPATILAAPRWPS